MFKNKIYTGIGSRETPTHILDLMCRIGATMGLRGWTLRSGHAPGADQAFEDGCKHVEGKMEIFLPWNNFEEAKADQSSYFVLNNPEAMRVAAKFHPNWPACSDGARKMHARNVHQVAGVHLDTASDMVICWTPKGERGGGTGQALRIAEHLEIPIFDLAICTQQDILSFLNHGVSDCPGCDFHG